LAAFEGLVEAVRGTGGTGLDVAAAVAGTGLSLAEAEALVKAWLDRRPVTACRVLAEVFRRALADGMDPGPLRAMLDRLRLHPLCVALAVPDFKGARALASAMGLEAGSPWLRAIVSRRDKVLFMLDPTSNPGVKDIRTWPPTLRVFPNDHVKITGTALVDLPTDLTVAGSIFFTRNPFLERTTGRLRAGQEIGFEGHPVLASLGPVRAYWSLNVRNCRAFAHFAADTRARLLTVDGCPSLAALPEGIDIQVLTGNRADRLAGIPPGTPRRFADMAAYERLRRAGLDAAEGDL
jgi:hypothetical protein